MSLSDVRAPSMSARVFALSLGLLFGVQTAAAGNISMDCRYSGKIMEDCPCPESEPHAALSRQSCCEVRQSAPSAPAAIIRELPQLPSSLELLPPPPWRYAALECTCKLDEKDCSCEHCEGGSCDGKSCKHHEDGKSCDCAAKGRVSSGAFTCPMRREVQQPGEGVCPKCNMKLEKAT